LKITTIAKSKSIFILCVTIISAACFCAGSLAQSGVLSIKILHHTDESDGCVAMMQTGISTIPVAIQQDISAAGISVVLTPTIVYDEPEASGQRFFRDGGTTQNLGGLFERGKSRVLIPERASVGNGAPSSMGSDAIRLMRHELGHAWDDAKGRLSEKGPFIAAYDLDFGKLTNEQCHALAYCITGVATSDANIPTTSGHQECFAEAFAQLTTPRSKWNKTDIQQSQGFPHVAAYLQTLNPELGNLPEVRHTTRSTVNAATRSSGATRSGETSEENPAATSNIQYEQAVIYFKQKLYTQALDCLGHAIELNPDNGKAFLLRGTTNMWLRNYKTAVQDYTDYIRIHPRAVDGYVWRARAYGYMGMKVKQDTDMATANSLR
jgi:Tetratricopeptide repeat